MDRNRFKTRIRELRNRGDHVSCLTALPDRITAQDLKTTADMLRDAAFDIELLLEAKLTGCICRRIEDESYDYVLYDRECRHHGHLWRLEKQLKESYAKKEKKLMDEARMSLIRAVLSGAASCNPHGDDDDLVKRAISIADGTLDRLVREDM